MKPKIDLNIMDELLRFIVNNMSRDPFSPDYVFKGVYEICSEELRLFLYEPEKIVLNVSEDAVDYEDSEVYIHAIPKTATQAENC